MRVEVSLEWYRRTSGKDTSRSSIVQSRIRVKQMVMIGQREVSDSDTARQIRNMIQLCPMLRIFNLNFLNA